MFSKKIQSGRNSPKTRVTKDPLVQEVSEIFNKQLQRCIQDPVKNIYFGNFQQKQLTAFHKKKSTIDVSQNPAYVSTLLNQRTSCYCDSCLWKSLKYELCNFNEKYRYFPTIFLSLLSANSTKKVNTLTQFVSFCRRIV